MRCNRLTLILASSAWLLILTPSHSTCIDSDCTALVDAHAALLQGSFEAAALLAEAHLAIKPEHRAPEGSGARTHNAHHILGHCRYHSGNLTGAVREFLLASKEQPDSVTEWLNLADVLKFTKLMHESQAAMNHVVYALGQGQLSGRLAGQQLWTADWTNYTEHRAMASLVMRQEHALWLTALQEHQTTGIFMHTNATKRVQLISSTSATDLHDIPPRLMPWASFGPVIRAMSVSPPELLRWPAGCGFDMHCKHRTGSRKRALKIGLLSPDWANHPVVELAHGMLEQLAQQADFELVLLPQNERLGDLTAGLVHAAAAVVHINGSSVRATRQKLRALHLDIVVDMAGHTVGGGFGLLAGRVAPLQVAYLGYPATTAAPWFDFVIADSVALPADTLQAGSHTERIAYMRGSYIPSSHVELHYAVAHMAEGEWQAHRNSLLLSVPQLCAASDMVLLGVLSGQHKIDPRTMSMWLNILQADACTVLVLTSTGLHEEVQSHLRLRRWVQQRGIDPHRLQWLPRLPRELHLKVKSALDLILDSPLKSGHSSHADAMWAGVPVVTMGGQHMHNRAPISLCQGELEGCAIVASSQGEYVASVLELLEQDSSGERSRLRTLQQQLKERIRSAASGTVEPAVWSTASQAGRFGQALHAMHAICSRSFVSTFARNAAVTPQLNAGRLEGALAWGGGWSGCRNVGHVFAGSRMLWRSVLAHTKQTRAATRL